MALFDNIARSARILVVDDHLLTRDMVRSILKGAGFTTVESADNGKTALTLLADQKYDLVISDWNMPQADGLTVLTELRKTVNANTPFIMLTAEAYRENVAAAIKAGVSDYATKPFTAMTLLQKIEGVFAHRAESQKLEKQDTK